MARQVPRLSRRGPQREPKRRFILYCEGSNAERDYFNTLKRSFGFTLIEIEINRGVGVPRTVADKAIRRALQIKPNKRRKENSFEENDAVWAIFDRDTHPDYQDAVARCQANHVKVGTSNPCFELWLILHIEDFDRPDDHKLVQRRLRVLRPEYDPQRRKTLDCSELVESVGIAEDRAELQLTNRQREGEPHGRPSTTVHQLTRAIREAAEKAK